MPDDNIEKLLGNAAEAAKGASEDVAREVEAGKSDLNQRANQTMEHLKAGGKSGITDEFGKPLLLGDSGLSQAKAPPGLDQNPGNPLVKEEEKTTVNDEYGSTTRTRKRSDVFGNYSEEEETVWKDGDTRTSKKEGHLFGLIEDEERTTHSDVDDPNAENGKGIRDTRYTSHKGFGATPFTYETSSKSENNYIGTTEESSTTDIVGNYSETSETNDLDGDHSHKRTDGHLWGAIEDSEYENHNTGTPGQIFEHSEGESHRFFGHETSSRSSSDGVVTEDGKEFTLNESEGTNESELLLGYSSSSDSSNRHGEREEIDETRWGFGLEQSTRHSEDDGENSQELVTEKHLFGVFGHKTLTTTDSEGTEKKEKDTFLDPTKVIAEHPEDEY